MRPIVMDIIWTAHLLVICVCGRHSVPPARPQGALAPGRRPLLLLLLLGRPGGGGLGQGSLPVRLVGGLALCPHILVGGHVVQRDVAVEYAEVEQQPWHRPHD